MGLIGMTGGQPIPTPSGGDDAIVEGTYSGRKKEDELHLQERYKRLIKDDEEILLILSQFIVQNNSN